VKMPWVQKVLPEPGPGRQLVLATLVVSLGMSLYTSASVLYFHRQLGISIGQIGIAFTIAAVVGIPLRIPIGHLADRYGPREVTAIMECALGLALIGLCFATTFISLTVMISIVALAESGANVVFGALVSGAMGREGRVKISAYMRSVFNGGFAAGAAIAGVVLALDQRPVYLAAIAGYGLARILVGAARLLLPRVPATAPVKPTGPRFAALRDLPYAALGQVSSVYTLCDKILLVGVPLWIVSHTTAPAALAAVLLGLSTLIVTIFQVRATKGVDTVAAAGRSQLRSLLALASCCVLAGLAAYGNVWFAVTALVVATVALTLGEMWGAAAAWELRYELADPAAQGQYGAVFSLGLTMPNLLGPTLVTVLVNQLLFGGWLVLTAVFVVAAVLTGPAVRWASNTRSRYVVAAEPVAQLS
jgi:MFS family permease